ncbi:SDR family oxidoreductase [Kibdelosporangium phytohabitans]|uniref:Short-chain dehydrogenase n=1 Tax=Kibdelosporangium phytohabitans TaxID=860235 RepID=A0A0N9HUC7_9PSEU|nr:SDR family oxidoreductase [Kibdelosporangium phytohabitans]ALG07012.1 short-chain dehydrogenase [Kibdelosporangium phytohabitans]MBE1468303.1 NAD(P)-dependent dehydrogenase (short-subunit alcohol dehydrogenase family) [Kibdelosporangium phytohabitans]
MGLLDGRVAIVTGAAHGIGRAHALLLAREGARVVVNDVEAEPLAEVADAIGGEAHTGSIADWDNAKALVQQAVDSYGRLDVVVNNAGILRDSFLASTEESQFDAVIAVHLKGHFAVMHHAAAHWKAESKAGRQPNGAIINTSSISGTTMPNPGQTVYGAAKAGIAAMTLVAAMEMERYGVRVNAIAPIARTRLTLATPGMGAMFAAEVPEGQFDAFDPANIAPVVAYLASEKCPFTGKVFTVQGGAISLLEGWRTVGNVERDGPWDAAELGEQLSVWA